MIKNLALVLLAFALAVFTLSAFPAGQTSNSQAPSPQAPPNPVDSAPAAEQHQTPAMGAGMASQASAAVANAPPTQPWCEDQAWSVFNHRASGWFLLFWGATALIVGLQWPRRTWTRFVPPMFLFGLAEFLFFRNDPEAWPVGPMSFRASLHQPEDLQHRVFLLLVILLALIELLRAADRLSPFLAKYGLPLLAVFGATFLFFHKHGGMEMAATMEGTASGGAMQRAMASMDLVRHEHLWFSIFGFGLAAAKLLADLGYLKGRKSALWSVFAVLLGVYMIGYIE